MDYRTIRVVVIDPTTRDAITTSFNSMEEVQTWVTKQIEEPKGV